MSYDAVVIGAGLAGLSAAIKLQQGGWRVLVVEERSAAGGLCGTFELDGYRFVIACNDFGSGIRAHLKSLGVDISMQSKRSVFYSGSRVYTFPPTLRTAIGLLPVVGDVIRLARALRSQRFEYLGPALESCLKNRTFRDFAGSFLGYPLGSPPVAVALDHITAELRKDLAYGYQKPCVPVGGPQALVDALVDTFVAVGGTLELGVRCDGVERGPEGVVVRTSAGTTIAKQVVSSRGRWDEYPGNLKEGLAIGMVHIAAHPSLTFDRRIHTRVYLPEGGPGWLAELDAGSWPEDCGFHLFCSDPPDGGEYVPINLYFFCPRGVDEIDGQGRRDLESQLLDQAQLLLPGLRDSIAYQRTIMPGEFQRIHGLSSRPQHVELPAGFVKPAAYDPATGVHTVGNSVAPAGQHAGGAVLSAIRVADSILEAGLVRSEPVPSEVAASA